MDNLFEKIPESKLACTANIIFGIIDILTETYKLHNLIYKDLFKREENLKSE